MTSLLLPRPLSFLANSLMFTGGVLIAWWEGGQPASAISWPAVLGWFLVQEFLAQQAKYQWNDMRDHAGDQALPANRRRPVTRAPLSPLVYLALAMRLALALWLAWLLSPQLLPLVLLIIAMQIGYEFLAKPAGGRYPALPLFFVAGGALLKFWGGALAVGWPAGQQRLLLYGLALFATGVVYGASYWRVEAEHFRARHWPWPRRQSAHFALAGRDWLWAGAGTGLACGLLLLLDAYRPFLPAITLPLVLAAAVMMLAGAAVTDSLFWLQRRAGTRASLAAAAALPLLLFGEALATPVPPFAPVPRPASAAFIFLLVLLADYRYNAGSTYRQQNLLLAAANWPALKALARERPLCLRRGPRLLWLALHLNSPRFPALALRAGDEAHNA